MVRKTIIDYRKRFSNRELFSLDLLMLGNDEWKKIVIKNAACAIDKEKSIDFLILLGIVFFTTTRKEFLITLTNIIDNMCNEDYIYWFGVEEEAEVRNKQIDIILEHCHINKEV